MDECMHGFCLVEYELVVSLTTFSNSVAVVASVVVCLTVTLCCLLIKHV